jgi:hypothetical protein
MAPGPGVDDNGIPVIDLRHAPAAGDLVGAELSGFALAGIELARADLTGAVITDCDLRGADLGGAVLQRAHIVDTDLADARLEAIDGRALYLRPDVDDYVPEARRHELAMSFVDVLAELHALDPDEVGLGGLGKKEDYVARQLHRWHTSWLASKTDDRPLVERVHDTLVERIPVQEPARVVHGDYGLHNCLSHHSGHIAAVVD